MGKSNYRMKMPLTVHHIVNRIAHRVFFLQDDERNDFIEMMRRAAEFTGIKLIGWCIMTNHFHILAFLPERIEVDEAEILRRVEILKGKAGASALVAQLTALRKRDITRSTALESEKGSGESDAQLLLERYRKRMYDIGSFMKILKQWFTEEYNRRSAHVGTLWESAYIDRVVPWQKEDLTRVLAYIFLNPIRAGACPGFDEYTWSSLRAAVRGDAVSIDGLRFVYGEEMDLSSIIEAIHAEMNAVLEKEKRSWANEVARRRHFGYAVPQSPLTDEAYVAQAAAHLDQVIKAGMQIHVDEHVYQKCLERRKAQKARILDILRQQPMISISGLSRVLKQSKTFVYRCVGELIMEGMLWRDEEREAWIVLI